MNFISKLNEKVLAKQLNTSFHFITQERYLLCLSVCIQEFLLHRKGTAQDMQNDIFSSVDSGKAVPLTLLDLSPDIDTTDDSIFIGLPKNRFGVDGTVFQTSNKKTGVVDPKRQVVQ